MSDAAVERVGMWLKGEMDAELILDALPDLLREESAAGEALRERLGLNVEKRPFTVGLQPNSNGLGSRGWSTHFVTDWSKP